MLMLERPLSHKNRLVDSSIDWLMATTINILIFALFKKERSEVLGVRLFAFQHPFQNSSQGPAASTGICSFASHKRKEKENICIVFVNMNCTFCILLVCIKLCIDHFPLHHHHLHPTYTSTMATAFHSHIHSSPDPWSSFPTVNPHSILRTPTCSRPFPHLVISFPPTGLFPSQNADSVHYVK